MAPWQAEGGVELKDVRLKYRPAQRVTDANACNGPDACGEPPCPHATLTTTEASPHDHPP